MIVAIIIAGALLSTLLVAAELRADHQRKAGRP